MDHRQYSWIVLNGLCVVSLVYRCAFRSVSDYQCGNLLGDSSFGVDVVPTLAGSHSLVVLVVVLVVLVLIFVLVLAWTSIQLF